MTFEVINTEMQPKLSVKQTWRNHLLNQSSRSELVIDNFKIQEVFEKIILFE